MLLAGRRLPNPEAGSCKRPPIIAAMVAEAALPARIPTRCSRTARRAPPVPEVGCPNAWARASVC